MTFVSESVINEGPGAARQHVIIQKHGVIAQVVVKIFDLGAHGCGECPFGAAATSKTQPDLVVGRTDRYANEMSGNSRGSNAVAHITGSQSARSIDQQRDSLKSPRAHEAWRAIGVAGKPVRNLGRRTQKRPNWGRFERGRSGCHGRETLCPGGLLQGPKPNLQIERYSRLGRRR